MANESMSSQFRDALLRRMVNEARGLKQAARQFGDAVEAMAAAVKENAATPAATTSAKSVIKPSTKSMMKKSVTVAAAGR